MCVTFAALTRGAIVTACLAWTMASAAIFARYGLPYILADSIETNDEEEVNKKDGLAF